MLTGPGVDLITFTNAYDIWSDASGSLALVARTGDQAPGMPVGAVFTAVGSDPSALALNAAGQMAFNGSVTGGGVDANNDRGIWLETSGSLALVVRDGTPAPGTLSGVNFQIVSSTAPALNDAGQIAFSPRLTGTGADSTNNLGIWSGAPGSLALVARSGEHVPETEEGVVFQDFDDIPSLLGRTFILNAAGQTAFSGTLTGSGISESNNIGIWATDRSGILQLIARTSDPLEVTPRRLSHGQPAEFSPRSWHLFAWQQRWPAQRLQQPRPTRLPCHVYRRHVRHLRLQPRRRARAEFAAARGVGRRRTAPAARPERA
jgi:hypothetical protein